MPYTKHETIKPQKPLTEYNYKFYEIIHQFLETLDTNVLFARLFILENDIKINTGLRPPKTMWFRLYPQDTLAHDVHSILADLNSAQNKDTILEDLEACVKNASVKIFFS